MGTQGRCARSDERSAGPRQGVRRPLWVAGLLTGVLVTGACAEAPGVPGAQPLQADVEFVGAVDPGWDDPAMVAASVRLASQLVALGEDDVVVSPLSLQLALAMLREGATGVVADEIDAAAGLSGDSQAIADLRAMLAQYEGDVAGIDPDEPPDVPLVHIVDGVFVQQGFTVVPTFLERVAAYHRAQAFDVDFAAGTAQPVLDAWVKEATGGLLDTCPAPTSADTRMVLMDAVTFGATWATQFAPEGTLDGTFTRADGTEVTVPFMHQTLSTPYVVGDGWVAAELPYTDGFAMRVLLPGGGAATLEEWLAAHQALDAASGTALAVAMPTWEADTTIDLTPALPDLGLGSLLLPGGGLDGVFPDAFVTAVAQGATITVGEKGTVAAAVTAIAMTDSAMAPPELELRLDRPFEYQIVKETTGLVLFAGRVADPS